jgi:hypothetical protein
VVPPARQKRGPTRSGRDLAQRPSSLAPLDRPGGGYTAAAAFLSKNPDDYRHPSWLDRHPAPPTPEPSTPQQVAIVVVVVAVAVLFSWATGWWFASSTALWVTYGALTAGVHLWRRRG